MAKLGTAFVSVEPDFTAFDRLVAQKLGSSFASAGEQSGRDFNKGFDKNTSGIIVPISRALRDVGAGADAAGVKARNFGREAAKAAGVAQDAVKKIGAEITDLPPLDIPTPKIADPVATPQFASLDRTGKLDISITGANAKLAQIQATLDALTSDPNVIDLDLKTGELLAKFRTVEKARDKLVAERAAIIPLSLDGTIDERIAAVGLQMDELNARKAALSARPQTIEVQTEAAQAHAELARLEEEKRRLTATKAKMNVEVDESIGSRLREIADSAKALTAGFGGGGLGDATTRVSFGFLSFGASLTPLVGLIAAAAVTIGVSLVGALAALVSSLALAAAGVAALGAAFGGVLAAGLALVIPVVVRMAKVFESLKADNDAADAAARGAAAGSQAAAAAAKAQEAAARGLSDANRSLADAQRQVGVAAKAAYREMADAAEDASDKIRGVETAQLSLDRAQISTERARLELEQFRNELGVTGEAFGAAFDKFTDVSVDTSGLRAAIADANAASGSKLNAEQELDLRDKILAVREARQREKDAIDGVSDATRASTRAQQVDNAFKREGIGASQGYQAALKGVEAAQRRVADAQRAVGDARDAAAVGAGVAAQEKAAQLAGRLTRAEVKLKETIQEVGKALRGAFTPATDAVVAGMTTGLSRIPKLVNPLRGAFKRLGEAWRDSIKTFSADLIRDDSITKMRAFTDGAAKLAGPVTRGISALLDILTDIARAALPYLISGTEKVADKLEDWAKGTANAAKLDEVIGNLVDHTKTWLGVAVAIGDVFLAFFVDAAAPGQALAENIKDLAERTAAWLRDDGREKLAQFFRDTIPLAKQVVGFFGALVVNTFRFGQIAAPILGAVFSAFGAVVGVVREVVHWFGEHETAATILLAVVGGVAAAFAAFAVGAGIAAAATAALSGAIAVLTAIVFANPIGLIVAAVVGLGAALFIAYKRSETFRNVVDGVFRAVKTVAETAYNFIRNNWKTLFVVLTGPFGLATLAIVKSFDTIKGAARAALGVIIRLVDGLAGAWSTMLTALSNVPGFGWAKRGAEAIDGAREKLRGLTRDLLDVPEKKTLRLNVALTADAKKALKALNELGTSVGGPTGRGSIPIRRALGGIVPGTGTGDTVAAMLTPGEYVTRQAIVNMIGPTVFADINAGRLDPRVGYEPGQRPTVSAVRPSGPRFATGGLAGAGVAVTERPNLTINTPITVPGGGPPDPVALAAAQMRIVESRGGFPRQS